MKKRSKRILALLLSAALSVTAFMQSAGAAVPSAPDGTAGLSGGIKTYKKDFSWLPLTEIDGDFVSAIVESDGSAVAGKPSEQWTTNALADQWYFQNRYLKPTQKGKTFLMTLKDTRTVNFRAKVELLDAWREYGIIFGQDTPTDTDVNSGAVRVRMHEHYGQIHTEGVLAETAKYTDSTLTQGFYPTTGNKTYDLVNRFPSLIDEINKSKDNEKYISGTYKLNIEVINGLMKVWWDGYEQYAWTVELNDRYDGGYISLYSNGYDQGGIKSFEFEDLGGYRCSFDDIDVSSLSDTFSASSISKTGDVKTGTPEEIWSTEPNPSGSTGGDKQNNYLKPAVNDGSTNLLTLTGVSLKNFRATMEFLNNWHDYGIYFGQKTGTDTDTSNGAVKVGMQENAGKIRAEGVNNTTPIWVGSRDYGAFYPYNDPSRNFTYNNEVISGFDSNVNSTNLHTLNIEVVDGVLKVWWSEYPDIAYSVQLNEKYTGGYISLYATGNAHGGIKDFAVVELDGSDYSYTFAGSETSELDSEFTSTVYDSASGSSQTVPVSQSWRTDNTEDASAGKGYIEWQYQNNALKPYGRVGAGKIYALTLNKELPENFSFDYTFIVGHAESGVVISDRPENYSDLSGNAVFVTINNAQIGSSFIPMLRVKGAIDTDTASVADTSVTLYNTDPKTINAYLTDAGFGAYSEKVDNKAMLQLNVKVEDQTLTAWVTGYENAALTVKLTAKYNGGRLSFCSNGCDQGGFVRLNVNELPDSAEKSAELGLSVKNLGEYTMITLDTDLAYSAYDFDLGFDSARYEFMLAVAAKENILINNDNPLIAESGKLPVEVYANPSGEIMTLYFKNLDASMDYSGFKITDISAHSANNKPVTVSGGIIVEKDYNGDRTISILDLIRAKKLSAAGTDEVDSGSLAALRKVLLGIFDDEEVSPLLGKSALYLGDSIAYGAADSYGLSWAGRVAQTGMKYENLAVSGWTLLGTDITGRGQIATQLDQASSDYYDFVILEGGVNDILIAQDVKYGIDPDDIEAALEDLIVKTKQKFAGSVIGYIINNEFGADSVTMEWYIAMAKDVCERNGIAWIDLNSEPYVTENFDAEKHLPDGLHPNADGYDILSVAITEWMEGLAEENY